MLPSVAERSPSPQRPLDALRRATFAHAAYIASLGHTEGEPGSAGAAGATSPVAPARAALKPKRRPNKS
jgi:hypothetical protein